MPANVISNRYELLDELNHGGMGDVWRGYDSVLDRPVAVKLIRQASVTSSQLAEELAKRFRREARITARIQHPGVPQALPVTDQLRAAIKEAYANSDALLLDDRFAQAAEVLSAVIEPAARALGSDSKDVLGLRKQRAAIRFLGGDFRAALPEFETLAGAYARTAGPTSTPARECRAQAARCRAELGQVTEALHELQDVLAVVRTLDSDVSEEAIDLRHGIAVLLLAQDRVPEALHILEPLHEDLVMVYGPDDDLAIEVDETLARIRLDLNGGALEQP